MGSFSVIKMKSWRMTDNICACYVFALTFLEVLGKTHMSVHDNNHDFIQANNNDVRFMGVHEGLQVFMHEDVASSGVKISQVQEDLEDEDAFSTSSYLKFVPPRLDFKERHLGVPHLEKVTLINTDNNKTIHMSSLSGNTLHFHSSFFQDKTIPPNGNTTFAVVFLGRAEGQVSSNLYIHTSEGTFRYQVLGASIGSPYRLRPLGGVRLPLNAAFQPLIELHNPHHYPIQVVEVYSSGSEFHLELPGGEMEGPKILWELPPYTTKPVIRAKFQATAQSNHTAYIRLKLNHSEEVLVVPLEVEVTSQPGLYSLQHFIDFGIGGSQDKPKKVILYLCSSLKKTLKIQSVSTVPSSSALKVNLQGGKIPPESSPTAVAELIFDWNVAFQTKQSSGKIVIKTKQNQYRLVIPFVATVLEGGLKINDSVTRFLTTEGRSSPRNLTVTNQFKIPVAISNVSLLEEAANYFEIKNFKPVIIPPNKSTLLLTIAPKEDDVKDLRLESGVVLFTNVSEMTISLLSYNGKLTKIFPRGFEDLELLDVGLVGIGSTKSLRFGLQNNNPVTINLRNVLSNSRFITPRILGIFDKNASEFLSQYSFANLTNSTKIQPNEIAVVELVVQASQNEEIMSAQILVVSQYEKLTIPVRVSVAYGKLDMIPKEIILGDCFPGKICIHPLKIQSSFNRPMTVTSITSVPPDSRMSFSPPPGGSEILPHSSSYIGDLKWEPGKNCGNHCYLGISANSSGSGLQWLQSDLLSPYISDMDATLLRDRYHRLLNLTDGRGSGHWQDIILRLDTNEVREELFKAKVMLIWPKFSNTSKLIFPLTQVTNTTIQRLKLYNPASHTIVVQLVTEWAYPQAKRLLDSFPPSFRPNVEGHCFNSSPKEFYISQDFSGSSEAHGKFNTTLAPGESYEVAIAYTPRSPQKSCSLLLIRNNLTIIEVIELHGQAAYAQLKVGNRKPGSDHPLMFEIVEKHLKDCKSDKNRKYLIPNLTVKRTFTIRNVGELAIYVKSFHINGLECEGYGFSVLNCAPFELPANNSYRIFIAFTPDFTLTRVQRTLRIGTSIGADVNYTLLVTLPPYFLSACNSVLVRPSWEPLLYYSAVSFMMFLLFCVLAAAFFESDRILKCALVTLSRDKATVPLDLRQIGTNVLKEFNQNSYKKVEINPDHIEKSKQKESLNNSGGWVTNSSSDDRQFGNAQKDETHNKNEDSTDHHKDKDCNSSSPTLVQLNNLTKQKKKFGKKNANSSDATEPMAEVLSNKRKDKNFQNAGWCSVFSRGNSASVEKIKMKLTAVENNNIKQIRNEIEIKKEEVKKEEKKQMKIKKPAYKEPNKEEEETSSTLTDSSNDAEKENADALSRVANDKFRKISKERKGNMIEIKDSNYEGDCDDDEFEKEKKHSTGKNTWKTHSKSNKFLDGVEENVWKPAVNEGQKNLDFIKHKVGKTNREKKEKTGNKRRFSDKAGNQKVSEDVGLHHSSPCWEFRSFSDVVAKNDNALYSNIVAPKNHQQKLQFQASPIFSEAPSPIDHSASALGPIGSKKPLSTWSPILYNAPVSQDSLFSKSFAESPSPFLGPSPEPDGSNVPEDTLQVDAENLWEDQHDAMELLHQRDTNYELSWKENWEDYLWCSNRNVQAPSDNSAAPQENFTDQSWGSLLRSSWESPWNSTTSSTARQTVDQNARNPFGAFGSLTEADSLMIHDLQNANLGSGQSSAILNPSLFNQNHAVVQLPGNPSGESVIGSEFQFDPFHSLSSIWSPKTKNPWDTSGN